MADTITSQTISIDLNIAPNAQCPVIDVTQYDNIWRTLQVKLYNGTDGEYTPTVTSAFLYAAKPDKTKITSAATQSKTDLSTFTVNISSQVTAVSGDVRCIFLFKGENNSQFGSAPFIIRVHENPIQASDIVSSDSFDDFLSVWISEHKEEIEEIFDEHYNDRLTVVEANVSTLTTDVEDDENRISEIRGTLVGDLDIDIFSDVEPTNTKVTQRGISYLYDADNRVITANGTLTTSPSNAQIYVIDLPSCIGDCFKQEVTYRMEFSTNNDYLHYRVSYLRKGDDDKYSDCATATEISVSGSTFTIPKETEQVKIACTYTADAETAITNGEVSVPSIYIIDSLKDKFDGTNAGYDIVSQLGLRAAKAGQTKTQRGITFAWSKYGSYVGITGTLESGEDDYTLAFNSLIDSPTALPSCLVAGETYDFSFKLGSYTAADLNTCIEMEFFYEDGTTWDLLLTAYSTTFTIPSDCIGIKIHLYVKGTQKYESTGDKSDERNFVELNTRAYMPSIYWHPSDCGVYKKVNVLNDAVLGSEEYPLANIRYDTGLLDCFKTVGVIGDSLASGSAAYKTSTGEPPEFKNTSWPQFLARMTGNTYYNFTKGGMNTKKWVNGYATDLLDGNPFDGNHNCTAYIIGLGENDCTQVLLQENETGTDDIGDSTKETFYRYYGEIIQMIHDYVEKDDEGEDTYPLRKAKIFCLTNPTTSRLRGEYNEAVQNIVKFFHDEKGYPVYLIDLYKYGIDYYYSEWIRRHGNNRKGHFNAVSYRYMANIIATYIDWFIKHNPDEFNQIEFIGTDYSY